MKIIKNFITCFSIALISQGFLYTSITTIAIDNNKVIPSNSLSISVTPTPSTTNPLVATTPKETTSPTTTSTPSNSKPTSTTIAVDNNKVTSSNNLSLSATPAPSTVNHLITATPQETTPSTSSTESSSTTSSTENSSTISTTDVTTMSSTTIPKEDEKTTPAPSSTPTTQTDVPSSNNTSKTNADSAPSSSSTPSSTSSSTATNSTSSTEPTTTPSTPTVDNSSTPKTDVTEKIPTPPIIKLNSFLISVHIQNNFTEDATLQQIELSLSGKKKPTTSNKLNIKLPGIKNIYDRGSITTFDITTKDSSTKSFNGIKSITVDSHTINLNNKGVGWSSAHPIYITKKDGAWVLDI